MKETGRRIRDNILFRTLLIVATTASTVYLFSAKEWLWAGISAALLLTAAWWIRRLHQSQIRKVIYMLDALENNDITFRFPEEEVNRNDRLINMLLNRVARMLYEVKAETAQQEKYYELILNCINTGIIVLNDSGAVYQKNDEALRIFGLNVFTHLRQLDRVDPGIVEKLSAVQRGDMLQLLFANERGTVNLTVRASDITIHNEHLRILVLSDINKELDEKEIDSWIRLIRVLTHEIMNSVTPITSLSDTLLSQLKTDDEELRSGLQTISATGKGLLAFVESYRKFTRIPTPEPSLFYLKAFIDRMVELSKHHLTGHGISFHIDIAPTDLILYADENLISQVIINLLKNAIEAIGNQPDGTISIRAYSNANDEIWIEIGNNGPQIPPQVAEQIFIPFFTTKEGGSGIGLSLSRQIMRLSGGTLVLLPTGQRGETVFGVGFR